MADREKVIKGLCDAIGIIHGYVPKRYWGYGEQACRDALALLKEQDAVEPLPQNSNGWVRTIRLWYCGACHSKISRRSSKYCPNCGKPILWEGR